MNTKALFSFSEESGLMQIMEIHLKYSVSSSLYKTYPGYSDQSWVAQINHTSIGLTPLFKVCIPPPLAEKSIDVKETPSLTAFHADFLLVGQSTEILFIHCESAKIYVSSGIDLSKAEKMVFLSNGTNKIDGVLLLEYVSAQGSTLKTYEAKLDGEVVKLQLLHERAISKVSSWTKSPEKYWKDQVWTEQD